MSDPSDDPITVITPRLELHEFDEQVDAPVVLRLLNEPSFIEFIGDRAVKRLVVASPYWDHDLRTLRGLQGRFAGVEAAARESAAIKSAVNVFEGRLVYRAVADAFGMQCEALA